MTDINPRIPRMDGEEIHIADYIRVIRKRLLLFLAVFVLAAAGGTVYTFMMTPVYQAEIKLEILDVSEQDLSVLTTLSGLKKDRIETEIEKIRSRDIARKIVRHLELQNAVTVRQGTPQAALSVIDCPAATFAEPFVFRVAFADDGSYTVSDPEGTLIGTGRAGRFTSPQVTFTAAVNRTADGDVLEVTCRNIEASVEELMRATSVARIGETGILGIAVTHGQPRLAKRIVDEYYTVYAGCNLEQKNASAREVNRFISERKAFYETKLAQASTDLQSFKEANNVFSLDSSNASLIGQIGEIESGKAVKTVELERIDNALAIIRGGDEKRFIAPQMFAPQSAMEQLSSRLSMLQVERKQLLNGLTDDHPSVVDVDIQIAEIEKGIIDKLNATHAIIEGELKSVEEQLTSFNARLKSLPQLDKDMVQKIRDVKFYDAMVLQMATKAEEFSIVEVSTLSSVRVAQAAVVPVAPVRPRKTVNIVLTLIVAAVAGLGLVFLREYFDNSFISTEDVEETLEERVLVTIPFMRRRFSRDVHIDHAAGLAYLSMDSPVTESFKTLKTSVEFLDIGSTHKIYQVTSSISGEGKSTIIANLAITFANMGARTLLIDADYKKPMQHKILHTENQVGFCDVICRGMAPHEAIQDTVIPNLTFMSSGQPSAHVSPNIILNNLAPILEGLRSEYDYILIDTPPLMAIDDSIRIGKLVDGVLLVVALGNVDRDLARRCKERCHRNGLKVAGIVVNDRTETEKYSRGFKYYQYYHYGEQPKADKERDRTWRVYIRR